jgi:alcohol dehydrogenase class IV
MADGSPQGAPTGSWNYPTPITFGPGTVDQLGAACRGVGMHRPLLVTDQGLAEMDPADQARSALAAAGLAFGEFSDFGGNPNGSDVAAGTDQFRQGGHDGVVALGGGSALDMGKAIGLMGGQDRPLWDFEDVGDAWTRADAKGIAPVVALPTTAGTGSEVGRCSVIVHEMELRKVVIFHPDMLPRAVIADPGLGVGLPPHLTAAVGMDALSHNLEAYCAPGFHPMADGIALEGMRLVHQSLLRVFADGSDLAARADMLAAATMGATAFQKGLGAMHSLSHPIGAHLGAHHGLTNAVVMPYVLCFNRSAIDQRMAVLARTLGIGDDFDAVLSWILGLREALHIPHTLAALGFAEEHAALLAPEAARDPTASTNPVPLDPVVLEGLYLDAFHGRL